MIDPELQQYLDQEFEQVIEQMRDDQTELLKAFGPWRLKWQFQLH
jgi:hypothetical protein